MTVWVDEYGSIDCGSVDFRLSEQGRPVTEIDIGRGKTASLGYALDDVSIVPSRRTRDADDIDVSWQLDAYQFDIPVISAALDGVSSPRVAQQLTELGGAATLHLEGLWTRYENPEPILEEIGELADRLNNPNSDRPIDEAAAINRMRKLYEPPVQPELIDQRIHEMRDSGAIAAVAVSPAHTEALLEPIKKAEPDLLVIQGTVTSAEHVSTGDHEPLDLKYLVRRLDIPVIVGGCSSYQAALHLMRTGAAGILVGVGPGWTSTTQTVLGAGAPQATAIADARAARIRHLDETGVYVHIIADGGMTSSGDIAKAIVCGADAVMLGSPLAQSIDAPARGAVWSPTAFHNKLPRGRLGVVEPLGTLEDILFGPSNRSDGRTNLIGGLRKSMAVTGYGSLKEFQKAELSVARGRTTSRGNW